ncbi:hypothetical protein ERX37_06945 [Macrococcus hajekii]|uniref:Uncharacterized protein n=1 Tax=Macrococcus hajekii TaxID=198482 RepID=A0A4R6BK50_9STAP|nr:hypothetical protein [Macrococcus hajekii]TDM01941.1 hypothetical protein ERX37_06945 [Macrococcus hajekii]GGB08718.1 hypothetical protein GCM10007190_15920 [Macrococcus hajekii]
MLLLQFLQSELIVDVGLFENEEQIKNWLKSLPVTVEDDTYYLEGEQLSGYTEVNFESSRYPLTRYSFDSTESILINWFEVPIIPQINGMVEGATKVDAYMVENSEVKSYIETRDEAAAAITDYYTKQGKQVVRAGLNSEDGEYLLVDGAILTHLDSMFIDDWANSESVEAFIKQIEE